METCLIAIGNSYGVRLPKSLIRQFNLDKSKLEIIVKDDGLLIAPVVEMPPLSEWDRLFKKATKNGFNAEEAAAEFKD